MEVDNQAIISASEEHPQHIQYIDCKTCKDFNMKMNTHKKSQVITIARDERKITILIDSTQLKQVKEFVPMEYHISR